MVSEEANRNPHVTLFAAIYDGTNEPGATLKRVPRLELRFRSSDDRAAVVRHRLFEDADSSGLDAADALIRSYTNIWKRLGVDTPDEYLSRLKKAYPFLPELIELVFERITESGGFQGTRGALGLLAAMLDAEPSGSFLLTAAHCKLTDQACADRLQDLDPSATLINCATKNLRDLSGLPHAEALASAALLSSLAPAGRMRGVSREELIRHVVAPGCDPNEFESCFQGFRTYGSFFHEHEGRFSFDLEENEYAKVALATLHLKDERARSEIETIWKQELFGDTKQTVFFSNPDTTRYALENLSKNSPRYVLSPRRLSNVERHELYFGAEQRNQILLFEPRNDETTAASAERRNRYEGIAGRERKNVRDTIKASGLMYIRIEKWSERPEQTEFELESIGQAWNKEEILKYLRTHIYPLTLIQEHLAANIDILLGQTISQVAHLYRNTLAYPVPLSVTAISEAIIGLVEDCDRVLGLHHTRRNFCGEHVTLFAGEIPQAILAKSWPETQQPPSPVPTPERPGPVVPPEIPEAISTVPQPSLPLEERRTISCTSIEELREQVAIKIQDMENPKIHKVEFTVFANYENEDLSGHPSTLRGGLNGTGSLEVQIKIACPGPMDKAEIESRCESLPRFNNAFYQATLNLEPDTSLKTDTIETTDDDEWPV
jgi:hypothetical protein